MKLEVGMYVRTKEGYIEKICAIENEHIYTDEDYLSWRPSFYAISKASYNIIDLIEEGDYVNGRKVYQVGYNFADEFVLKMSESNYEDFIYPNKIETIVTKEQFESMSYKVKE